MDLDNLSLSPASFKKRFTASLIDLFFPLFIGLLPAAYITYTITGSDGYKTGYMYIFLVLIWFLIYFGNVIAFQMKTGKTLGKLIIGVKVCYPNHKIDVRKEDIVKREFSKLFTIITLGYSFFKNYKNEEILSFHDEYSKTVVLVLTEEHEEYLHEYHYEEYFTSEEEDKEYEKIKKEKEEVEKQQKEQEKQEKEYQKQLKKEEKVKEKEKKDKEKKGQHQGAEQMDNLVLPNQNNSPAPQSVETPPVMNNEDQNIYPMNQPVQTYKEGINIVGGNDFLGNSNQDDKSKGKLKGLFGGQKDNKQSVNNIEETNNYNNPKFSELVQDNNFLPSENIYSELYKGWDIREANQEDVKKILNKKQVI